MPSKVYDLHHDGDAIPMAYSPNKGVVVPIPEPPPAKELEKEKDEKGHDKAKVPEKEDPKDKITRERKKEKAEVLEKIEKEPGEPLPDGYEYIEKAIVCINFPPVNAKAVLHRIEASINQYREIKEEEPPPATRTKEAAPKKESKEAKEGEETGPKMEVAQYDTFEAEFPTDVTFIDVLVPIGAGLYVESAQEAALKIDPETEELEDEAEVLTRDHVLVKVPESPKMLTGITIEYKGTVRTISPTPTYVPVEDAEGEGGGPLAFKKKVKEKEKEKDKDKHKPTLIKEPEHHKKEPEHGHGHGHTPAHHAPEHKKEPEHKK